MDYPPFLQQVNNAFNALKEHVKDKGRFADKELRELRAKTCFNCEFIDSKKQRCTICGCFIYGKVLSLSQSCPKKKW